MRLLLLSDVHIIYNNPICRLDDLVSFQYDKLKFIFDYAIDNNIKYILQSGDWVDNPRNYKVLSDIAFFLKEYKDNVSLFCVFGQHDTYMYSELTRGATNLGVLERTGLVTILGSKPTPLIGISLDNNTHAYGVSYGEEIPEVESDDDFNVLVIHAPITDQPIHPKAEAIDAHEFLATNKDYNLILCGDIHRRFCIGDNKKNFIINTGPMIRKTADEYNLAHIPSFAVFDTEEREFEWVEIPHKPTDEVISRDHIDTPEETALMLEDFISEMKQDYEITVDLLENIQSFINKNKLPQSVVNIISETISRKKG